MDPCWLLGSSRIPWDPNGPNGDSFASAGPEEPASSRADNANDQFAENLQLRHENEVLKLKLQLAQRDATIAQRDASIGSPREPNSPTIPTIVRANVPIGVETPWPGAFPPQRDARRETLYGRLDAAPEPESPGQPVTTKELEA